MEAIQHMMLKFDIGDLLTIRYLHTQFCPNLKGVVLFCVDLARNDKDLFLYQSLYETVHGNPQYNIPLLQ